MINVKDLKRRITVRLNIHEYDFLTINAQKLGVSPSHYLRMLIDHYIASRAYRKALEVAPDENTQSN